MNISSSGSAVEATKGAGKYRCPGAGNRSGERLLDVHLRGARRAAPGPGLRLACLRQLGLADDAGQVNPHGGAIALGHPLGMSGARLVLTAVHGLHERDGKLALATMCVGVGQGVSLALERVS